MTNLSWNEIQDRATEFASKEQSEIEKFPQALLSARAQFPKDSLVDLYNPPHVPPVLTEARTQLDKAVDKLYRPEPFATDADRVAMLFGLYQSATRN